MAFWSRKRKTPALAPAVADIVHQAQRALDAMPPAMREPRRAVFDGIVNALTGMGMEGADRTASSFWAPPRILSQADLINMVRGSWLPRRIIETPAEDMTREWISRSWKGHDQDEEGPAAVEAEERRLGVRGELPRGLTWARQFGGGGLILYAKGQPLDQPMDVKRIRKGDLQLVMAKDRWHLSADTGEYITDPEHLIPGHRIGFPEYYRLTDVIGGSTTARIHFTHIVRLEGDHLDDVSWLSNGRWADSVLQSAMGAIKRYDVLASGIGSLIWDAKTDVLSIDGLKDYLATEEGEADLRKRFDAVSMARSLFGLLLLDKNDTYDRKVVGFAGINDLVVEFRNEVCGASRIPATKLWGQSPNGLNATGESDIRTYYDEIKTAQTSDLGPGFSYLDEAMVRSALDDLPKGYGFQFNPLWQMSDKDKAEVEKTLADRDKTYFDIGAVSGSLIARENRFRGTYATMRDDDVEMVEEMEAEPQEHDETTGAPPKSGEKDKGEEGDDADAKAGHDSVRDILRKQPDGWHVYSENGDKHLGGPYASKAEAETRLRQVEFFKAHDSSQIQSYVFAKSLFTKAAAASWMKRHAKVDAGSPKESDGVLLYEQQPVEQFEPGTLRSVSVAGGITALVGHLIPAGGGQDVVARRTFQGFRIAVENPAGSIRKWIDASGTVRGQTTMRNDYGFFEDHLGADGEELDCYLGPHEDAKNVYIVHQTKRPDYEAPDEDKVILGARTPDEALSIFTSHRDDGDRAIGSMSMMPVEKFRKKLAARAGGGKIRA